MTNPTNPQTTVAVISVKWGSSFQKEAGEKALREVLQAWREFYSEKHHGNDIKIDVAQSDEKTFPTEIRPDQML